MDETLRERIEALIAPADENGCRVWLGRIDKRNGLLIVRNGEAGPVSVRRVMWEDAHGPLGREFIVTGACLTPRCVEHLAVSTRGKAVLKRNTRSAINAIKTHCNRGHLLARDNLYISPSGARVCRLCYRKQLVEYRRRDPERYAVYDARNYSRHREARIASQHAYNAAHRDEINAKARAHRAALRQAGLCRSCKAPSDGYSRCGPCRTHANTLNRTRCAAKRNGT
jgi:hypothetical protein